MKINGENGKNRKNALMVIFTKVQLKIHTLCMYMVIFQRKAKKLSIFPVCGYIRSYAYEN